MRIRGLKSLFKKAFFVARNASKIGLRAIFLIAYNYMAGARRTFSVLKIAALHSAVERGSSASSETISRKQNSQLPRFSNFYNELRNRLARRSISKIVGTPGLLLYCGKTENNEKEFSSFSRWTAGLNGVTHYTTEQNISYWPSARTNTTEEELALIEVVCLCAAVVFWRIAPIGPAINRLTDYTRQYIRFCSFILSARTSLPKLAVVANDHSPTQVAFSMAMKAFGIPRLYLQHASVSRYFPRLDFEYSVLRDQNSKDIYSKLGKTSGIIYIVPRSAEKDEYSTLLRPLMQKESIVIYLSALYSLDSLRSAIAILQKNPQITSVSVKIHPRSRISEFNSIQSVVFSESFPTTNHVAIVPNSSVALDLLRKGIRVYQLFCLDPIDTDYYGFVRRGLTIPITLDDLASPFWLSKPYLRDRVERLRSADPSQSDEWLADLKRLERDLQPIIDPQSAVEN